ncbi:MAG: hypothetical protein AAF999_06355 [Pseudomonadota bacterium]
MIPTPLVLAAAATSLHLAASEFSVDLPLQDLGDQRSEVVMPRCAALMIILDAVDRGSETTIRAAETFYYQTIAQFPTDTEEQVDEAISGFMDAYAQGITADDGADYWASVVQVDRAICVTYAGALQAQSE